MFIDKCLSLCNLHYVCLLFLERQTYIDGGFLALTEVKRMFNCFSFSLFRNHIVKGNSLFPPEKYFVSAYETKCFATRNM